MGINQYFGVMMIGLAFSNLLGATEDKVSLATLMRSTSGNFAGFNFAVSVLAVIFCGQFFGQILLDSWYELVFCCTALIAESMNVKWRDHRSSSYATFVGVVTPLFHYWQPHTEIALITSAIIALGIVYSLRRIYSVQREAIKKSEARRAID